PPRARQGRSPASCHPTVGRAESPRTNLPDHQRPAVAPIDPPTCRLTDPIPFHRRSGAVPPHRSHSVPAQQALGLAAQLTEGCHAGSVGGTVPGCPVRHRLGTRDDRVLERDPCSTTGSSPCCAPSCRTTCPP